MKQKEGFVIRDICGDKAIVGEGVGVVNIGKLISVNETAAWAWQKAAELGDFTAEQLAEAICEEYDVEPAHALSDMQKLIATWQEAGLLE
jgi:hypothetical protein